MAGEEAATEAECQRLGSRVGGHRSPSYHSLHFSVNLEFAKIKFGGRTSW